MQAGIRIQSQTSFHPLAVGLGAENGYSAITPLLDLALTESNAQGAYLYTVDAANAAARLLLWSGLSPIAAAVQWEFEGAAVERLFSRTTPLVMREYAWEHPAFESLPEFRKHRFAGVSSIPLLESGEVTGLLNVCRSQPTPLKPREFSFLLSLGVPIAALMTVSASRLGLAREVDKLTRQLADRKVMERAKGLIQARFAWTEEEAYFCLRNLSRRRRTPMREIAEEVILTAASEITVEDATR
jgi:signal transduction protein with GAF and PtsI domain